MAKFMGRIMTLLAAVVIFFTSIGCSTTNNVTERGDKPTVTEKKTETTTDYNRRGDSVKTETKTTRE